MSGTDRITPDLQREVIGDIFFAVGGGNNDKTKEIKFNRAYRAFTVILVRGQDAFQRERGGVYVIGDQTVPGTEILRILNTESPWRMEPEHVQVAANHIVFFGDLNGRSWKFSRSYPDPTVERIARSLWTVLDVIPEAEAK